MNKNLTSATKALKRQGPKKSYKLTLQWTGPWKVMATDKEHAREITIEEWDQGCMNSMSNDIKPVIIKTEKQ